MFCLELAVVAGCINTIDEYTLGELLFMNKAMQRYHWDLITQPWASWLNANQGPQGRTYHPWEIHPVRSTEYQDAEVGIEVLKGMLE